MAGDAPGEQTTAVILLLLLMSVLLMRFITAARVLVIAGGLVEKSVEHRGTASTRAEGEAARAACAVAMLLQLFDCEQDLFARTERSDSKLGQIRIVQRQKGLKIDLLICENVHVFVQIEMSQYVSQLNVVRLSLPHHLVVQQRQGVLDVLLGNTARGTGFHRRHRWNPAVQHTADLLLVVGMWRRRKLVEKTKATFVERVLIVAAGELLVPLPPRHKG